MGMNDHLDDSELGNLPPEAFSPFAGVLDFNNYWLKNAERDDQLIAVREWFLARYWDPANDTPYNGREGGYQFIHGGPYDPADVLPTRFSGVVDADVIDEVVEDLHGEVGDSWAPVKDEFDEFTYDERLDFQLTTRDEPLVRLQQRLDHAQRILSLEGNAAAKTLAEQLVYSSIITSLEAFLWETADYWVEHDPDVLRNLVTQLEILRDQPMKLGEIFEQYGGLRKHVRGYLQRIVWHRLDEVARLYKAGFGIRIPSLKPFVTAIEKRHHIVHRSGYDQNRQPVYVTTEEISALSESVVQFARELDAQLMSRCL